MYSIELADCLYIDSTSAMGRGVFTSAPIPKDSIIEISPILLMEAKDRILVDQTPLKDYIFEWFNGTHACCVAWGYISMYNHQYNSNCEYCMDYEENIISVKTVRDIEAGEELFINYNGDWDNMNPLWFDAK